ncbi:MAG: DUF4190 domain-containing protein [Myxococcota bacterium]|nr:DUF4190 domain-containing protein [Myxococcota bacterium]
MHKQNNSLAVVSFILGLLGLVGLLPLIGSLFAIVLGHMARRQIAADPSQDGEGLALTGLIVGYIGLVLACSGLLVVLVFSGGSLLTALLAIFVSTPASAMLLLV